MIAQRLPGNEIIITNRKAREDALYVIPHLSVSEFYSLVKSTDGWLKSVNNEIEDTMSAFALESSDLLKEFNRLYLKRVISNGEEISKELPNTVDVNEKKPKKHTTDIQSKTLHYKSNVVGLYRLVHIKNTETIRLIKRGSNNINKPNSVCITNSLKREFINDNANRCIMVEVSKEENNTLYKKWLNIINKLYKEGLKEHKNENN